MILNLFPVIGCSKHNVSVGFSIKTFKADILEGLYYI